MSLIECCDIPHYNHSNTTSAGYYVGIAVLLSVDLNNVRFNNSWLKVCKG